MSDAAPVSQPLVVRFPGNPVLAPGDVPYRCTLAYNPGVVKNQGRYVMAYRNDYGEAGPRHLDGSFIGWALSDDGYHFTVDPDLDYNPRGGELRAAYDPRLTLMDGRLLMTFSLDTRHGLCGGIVATTDLVHYELLTLTTPDNRDITVFPETIHDCYWRLERPFQSYLFEREQYDIWISTSPDLNHWGDYKLLLSVDQVPYANVRVGAGAPPVRTDHGWLCIFHAVWYDEALDTDSWQPWHRRYTAGAMLLDLDDPSRVLGMTREPILTPLEPYELEGYRGSVVFPTALVPEEDGSAKLYYGAAGTVCAVAEARLADLVAACEPLR